MGARWSSSNRVTSYHLSNLDRKKFFFPSSPNNRTKFEGHWPGAGHRPILNQSLYWGTCSDWLDIGHILMVRNQGIRNKRGEMVVFFFLKRKFNGECCLRRRLLGQMPPDCSCWTPTNSEKPKLNSSSFPQDLFRLQTNFFPVSYCCSFTSMWNQWYESPSTCRGRYSVNIFLE